MKSLSISFLALIFYFSALPVAFSKQISTAPSITAATLNQAVKNADMQKVKQLLASGANPSLRDTFHSGYTALHIASLNSNEPSQKDIVAYLISSGAGLNIEDGFGNTPLNLLLYKKGNPEIAKLLIEKGADVNSVGFEGITPLASAVSLGNKEVIKALIAKGANANKKDSNGLSPLMNAAKDALITGDTGIMEILISGGADVNAKDNNGNTILTRIKEYRPSVTHFYPDKVISLLKTHGAK